MNTKHTEGPWSFGRQAGMRGFSVYLGPTRQSADDVLYVGTLGGSDEIVATDESNARLISAAPRLLAALERLALEYASLAAIARELADNLDESGCDHVSFCGANSDALTEARAALEKATGESRDCAN